jgi:hypothetical protein
MILFLLFPPVPIQGEVYNYILMTIFSYQTIGQPLGELSDRSAQKSFTGGDGTGFGNHAAAVATSLFACTISSF